MEMLSEEYTASFSANLSPESRGELAKAFTVYEKKASEAREKSLREATVSSEGMAEVAEVDTLKFWIAQVQYFNRL